MLDSVLSARARFLAPTGLMVPSQCSILLSLYDASEMIRDRVEFWDDVYGFKMASMKEGWSDDGVIETVGGSGVRSNECAIKVRFTFFLLTTSVLGLTVSFCGMTGRAYTNCHCS